MFSEDQRAKKSMSQVTSMS